jgi:hypothetical protein
MTTKCNSAFNLARQPGHVVSSPASMAVAASKFYDWRDRYGKVRA